MPFVYARDVAPAPPPTSFTSGAPCSTLTCRKARGAGEEPRETQDATATPHWRASEYALRAWRPFRDKVRPLRFTCFPREALMRRGLGRGVR